jgi:hypothetical protein
MVIIVGPVESGEKPEILNGFHDLGSERLGRVEGRERWENGDMEPGGSNPPSASTSDPRFSRIFSPTSPLREEPRWRAILEWPRPPEWLNVRGKFGDDGSV